MIDLQSMSILLNIIFMGLCAAIILPLVVPEDETGSSITRDFLITMALCAAVFTAGYVYSFN